MSKLTNKVRGILIESWDPLNVGSNPNLSDEYDHYIPRILGVINSSGCTEEELCRMLKKIEIEHLGGIEVRDRREAAAKLLHKLVRSQTKRANDKAMT